MIRVLPPEVVNQIAAGEVVERPFSVIKELVENSLDAGATRVEVELEEGGLQAMVVIDDGGGFSAADLELAFTSHATSKLSALVDLDHVASLGFRGEALASIGSVSRASIRSRQSGEDAGYEIDCDGGSCSSVRPAAGPPGSRIEIRDLFRNVPARRRFLRTARAERARIQELIARLSLARLDVDFTLREGERELLRLPAGEDLVARIRRAFGKKLSDHLIPVELERDALRVSGLIGRPEIARRDSTLALLYVNGRLARDRGTTAALRQAYREFLMHGNQPVHFLMLDMAPDSVDVNVHPAKAEVRFADERMVRGCVHEAARTALLAGGSGEMRGGAGALQVSRDKPRAAAGLPDLPADLFGREDATASSSGTNALGGLRAPAGEARQGRLRVAEEVAEPGASLGGAAEAAGAERELSDREHGSAAAREDENRLTALSGAPFVQALGTYLVFASDSGLVVVDQHALHERVMYERLRAAHDARGDARGDALVQRLLTPTVVDVTPTDKAWLLDQRDVLAEEGFLIDDFGGEAVAVHGVPAVLSKSRPERLLRDLLSGDGCDGEDGDARPRAREAVLERFHSMACRRSVMAGDRLDESEVRALLRDAAECEHPHNCPHGRPTVLTFSASELERFFRRRV